MTLIYFIILLTVTIFIHELGHFIFAKKAGVHIYEFAIGMGPIIYKWKRKNDETIYAIRLFPIGGFVSMAGEDIDPDEKIDHNKLLHTKTKLQRFLVITAGVAFNFILAFTIFFGIALFKGAPQNNPVIESLNEKYEIVTSGLQKGDEIKKINGKKISSIDRLMLEIMLKNKEKITLEIEREGQEKTFTVKGQKEEKSYKYGFQLQNEVEKGILPSLKFAATKTYNMLEQMVIVIKSLVTGELSLNSLSGPVGIYNIVGESSKAGLVSFLYLTALISINIGFINLIPTPALDGGRLLFLIIEIIRGKKVDPKIENAFHTIGFMFLIGLMIIVTFSDLFKIFK